MALSCLGVFQARQGRTSTYVIMFRLSMKVVTCTNCGNLCLVAEYLLARNLWMPILSQNCETCYCFQARMNLWWTFIKIVKHYILSYNRELRHLLNPTPFCEWRIEYNWIGEIHYEYLMSHDIIFYILFLPIFPTYLTTF